MANERQATDLADRESPWREENREAIDSYDRYIEPHRIPFAEFCQLTLPVTHNAPK